MNQKYISIQQIDQTILNYIQNIMKPSIEDHSGNINQVPVIYHGAQKWVQIRRRTHLVNENGISIYPVISFSRTNTKMKDQPSINKAWAMFHRNFIQVDNKMTQNKPGVRPTYFKINIPIQVECDYQFQIYTNTNWQMNQVIETFMIHNRLWWIIDDYRVKVTFGDFSNTQQIQTGTQRLIKAQFSCETSSMIYPKDLRIEQKDRVEPIVDIN